MEPQEQEQPGFTPEHEVIRYLADRGIVIPDEAAGDIVRLVRDRTPQFHVGPEVKPGKMYLIASEVPPTQQELAFIAEMTGSAYLSCKSGTTMQEVDAGVLEYVNRLVPRDWRIYTHDADTDRPRRYVGGVITKSDGSCTTDYLAELDCTNDCMKPEFAEWLQRVIPLFGFLPPSSEG